VVATCAVIRRQIQQSRNSQKQLSITAYTQVKLVRLKLNVTVMAVVNNWL